MEALRRACLRNGADAADVASDSDAYSDPESSGSDDIGLLCRLQERFSSPTPSTNLLPLIRPLKIIPPVGFGGYDDDNDDDLETLRAIQRRFSQYKSGKNSITNAYLDKHNMPMVRYFEFFQQPINRSSGRI